MWLERSNMRKAFLAAIVACLATAFGFAAQDPAVSIAAARQRLAEKRFDDVVRLLGPAIGEAEALAPGERTQALAAVHFYLAAGYSGLNDERRARLHLQEFFRLSPKSNRIDPTKYERRFVVLFNELTPTRSPDPDSFELYYPSFGSFAVTANPVLAEESWVKSPALEILGTAAEKQEWRSLATTADRNHFMAEFWQRRDPTRTTAENEFRDLFDRRVAFADSVFGTGEERGSLTDRGRVFVLLGAPSFVRRRPISRPDTTGRNRVWIPPDIMINGTIEQWAYAREQLPIPLSKPSITYRFVTQQGIGVGVLQKEDAYAMQALDAAANPSSRQ